ncbi:MAG: hypothetical protein EPO11_00675 [Gammaproteobacteria bacterium]|nr:MAG: hypothetical protein EPO11_00675 [Gammaproteobacteria bacterium]
MEYKPPSFEKLAERAKSHSSIHATIQVLDTPQKSESLLGVYFYHLQTTSRTLNDGYFFSTPNPEYTELKNHLDITSSNEPNAEDMLKALVTTYENYFVKPPSLPDHFTLNHHLDKEKMLHVTRELVEKAGAAGTKYIQVIDEKIIDEQDLTFYQTYKKKKSEELSYYHTIRSYLTPLPKSNRDFYALLIEWIQHTFPEKVENFDSMKIGAYLFVIHLIDKEYSVPELFNYSTLRAMCWEELCDLCKNKKILMNDDEVILNCVSTFMLYFEKSYPLFKDYIKEFYKDHPILASFETKIVDSRNELTAMREALKNPSSTFWIFIKILAFVISSLIIPTAFIVGNTVGRVMAETTLSYHIANSLGNSLAAISSHYCKQVKPFSVFVARDLVTSTATCAAVVLMTGLSELFTLSLIYGVAGSAYQGVKLAYKLVHDGAEGIQYLASLCIEYYNLIKTLPNVPDSLKNNQIYEMARCFMKMAPEVFSSKNPSPEPAPSTLHPA